MKDRLHYYFLWLIFTGIFGIIEIWVDAVIYPNKFENLVYGSTNEFKLFLIFSSSLISSTAFSVWTCNKVQLTLKFITWHIFFPMVALVFIILLFTRVSQVSSPEKDIDVDYTYYLLSTYVMVAVAFIYGSVGTVLLYENSSDQKVIQTP